MQKITIQPDHRRRQIFWWQVSLLIIGYLLALTGCSLFFSTAMIYFLVAGCAIIFFASRGLPTPAFNWRSLSLMIIGCVVILGGLAWFGEAQVRQWRPHPAGYIPAWIFCFNAFRQLHSIFQKRHVSATMQATT